MKMINYVGEQGIKEYLVLKKKLSAEEGCAKMIEKIIFLKKRIETLESKYVGIDKRERGLSVNDLSIILEETRKTGN